MASFLFNDFDTITAAAWKQKIQVDLNGLDYNESLIWKSNEGIAVKPFYTKEDRHLSKISLPDVDYNICQTIFVDNIEIANKLALDSIERGATAIQFIANKKFNYKLLLDKIDIDKTSLYLKLEFLDATFVNDIHNYYNNSHIYFQIDIIGKLASSGNWHTNMNSDIAETKKFIHNSNNSICVNASLYQNAGASIIQELAYALAHTNEYIEIFGPSIITKIHFNFSIGNNYFFEVAKLRAFRILLDALLNEYKIDDFTAHIFSKPTLRNKTIYDYNVNMLRTTSECMSAILGGVNTISNISYDSIYHKSNEFGERIARNQLLILKNEAYFSDAHKITDGSYYVESLEKQFAEKALQLFKQIEKSGGFLSQLKKGIIQRKINEHAEEEQDRFNQNKTILLGTNLLPELTNKMKHELQIYPFLKTNNSKTLIPPILKKRLSEHLEQKRLKKEL